MADKILRDPLYNYICIDKNRDGWLIDLLACPEVQRLRRIHQLGVSNYTYPGADHNRLAHSLGVVHLMQLVLNHLERTATTEKGQIESARMRLLAAALLHDVGHGPFSHLFEPCLGTKHEEWSIAIVLDPATQVNLVLARNDSFLPAQVADLIDSQRPTPPPWQKALLSSQLDVDRLDYLRRDSLFTGAGYGHFDWFRLLSSVEFYGSERDLVWPAKSALAIEEYIFARYYMYQNVYLHKTTRGYEKLLQALWHRARAIRSEVKSVDAMPALDAFWKSASTKPKDVPIGMYLALEEFTMLSQVQVWVSHSDKILADLARRFMVRDGFAMIVPPPSRDPLTNDFSEWEAAVQSIIGKAGFESPEAYCLRDTLDGKKHLQPYRPERERKNQTALNSIRIRIPGEVDPVEISEYLSRLGALTESPKDEVRYYVPKEVRGEVERMKSTWPSTD